VSATHGPRNVLAVQAAAGAQRAAIVLQARSDGRLCMSQSAPVALTDRDVIVLLNELGHALREMWGR
jgi:hypothetical protein